MFRGAAEARLAIEDNVSGRNKSNNEITGPTAFFLLAAGSTLLFSTSLLIFTVGRGEPLLGLVPQVDRPGRRRRKLWTRGPTRNTVPASICGVAVRAGLPVDAVSMATGGDRAGPEHSSRDDTTPAPAPDPQAGSPSCCAGLAPFGAAASSSPSPRPPNHWDPGLARDSGSSCRSGGAAMAGCAPGWATVTWQGRGAVGRDADAPCCCPYRDSGLLEAAVSAPPSLLLLQLGPSGGCCSRRFGSSFSPSSSSGAPGRLPPALLPCSRGSLLCLRCFVTPKPVITQVKMACFVRVLSNARQPRAC